MREALAAAALAALLARQPGVTSSRAEHEVRLEPARPPRSIGAAVDRAIVRSAVSVTLPDGGRARFWPARRIAPAPPPEEGTSPFLRERVSYAIAAGSLVGVIELSGTWTDARDQPVPAGTYALCYVIQPAIKEHRGVSESRDVLVLVAAREFQTSASVDALVEASRGVSGTGHPAVLALLPPPPGGDSPPVLRREPGRLVLEVRSGGIAMALILSGSGKTTAERRFDRPASPAG